MKLGLIAYCDDTGLGSQTQAYYDYLEPYRTLVIDRSGANTEHDFYPERMPNAWEVAQSIPDFEQTERFLEGLDVVLMAECSPTEHLMRVAKSKGVKTVIVPNWEYFHHLKKQQLILPDLLLAPSLWHFDDYPGNKKYLPLPIESRLVKRHAGMATNFVHIAGRPIYPDRNGTLTVLQALEYINESVKITIFCQKPGYIDELIAQNRIKIPQNVNFLNSTPVKNTADLYKNQHVVLMPRRFGGLCLPVNEALSYGLPVIMTDISPNNRWLPAHWLIGARKIDERKMGNLIDIYEGDPMQLADQVNALASEEGYFESWQIVANMIAKDYSWANLKTKYIETLHSVIS